MPGHAPDAFDRRLANSAFAYVAERAAIAAMNSATALRPLMIRIHAPFVVDADVPALDAMVLMPFLRFGSTRHATAPGLTLPRALVRAQVEWTNRQNRAKSEKTGGEPATCLHLPRSVSSSSIRGRARVHRRPGSPITIFALLPRGASVANVSSAR